jgi:hypothetical protein
MNKSELNPNPDLAIPTLPVICDRCRAEGMAGDELFAEIPDILDFEPVPRRARAHGWTPEHQRAFIAALAITGSPRQAARAIGKHEFGAKGLRTARGGRSFALAWEAAVEIARGRERERIHANLQELAEEARNSQARFAADDGEERGYECSAVPYDVGEVAARLEKKMELLGRAFMAEVRADPEKRRAYELLHGPVDWEKSTGGIAYPLGGEDEDDARWSGEPR